MIRKILALRLFVAAGTLAGLVAIAAVSIGCGHAILTITPGDSVINLTFTFYNTDSLVRMSSERAYDADRSVFTADDNSHGELVDFNDAAICTRTTKGNDTVYTCTIPATNGVRYYFKTPGIEGGLPSVGSVVPGKQPEDVRASVAFDARTGLYTVTVEGDFLERDDDGPDFDFQQDGESHRGANPEFVTLSSTTVTVFVRNSRGPNEGIKLTVPLEAESPTPTPTPLPTSTPTPTATPTLTPTPNGSCGPAPAGVMCVGDGDCASCSCDLGPSNPNFPQGTCN